MLLSEWRKKGETLSVGSLLSANPAALSHVHFDYDKNMFNLNIFFFFSFLSQLNDFKEKEWHKYPKRILSPLLRTSPAFHSPTRLRLKRKSHFSQWLISLETGSPGLPVSKTARGTDALNFQVSRCFSAIRTDNRKLQTLSISLLDTTRLRVSLNTEIEIQSDPSQRCAHRLNILSLSVDYLPNYSLYLLSQNAENVWIREPGSSVYKTYAVYILCHLAGWRVTSRQQLLQLLLHNS